MNKEEIADLIHNWLVDNELYYKIDPMDVKEAELYLVTIEPKLIGLYKLLVDNEVVPEHSYENFLNVFKFGFNSGRNEAFLRH